MSKQPRITEMRVREILEANGVDQSVAAVLAIRGYYLDSMGEPGRNDRRIYDDAIVIASPRGIMAYQGNTDPNGFRKGSGKGAGKGMAMLRKGIHWYGTGKHKGRLAFRQCEKVTVIRDGDPPCIDIGFHAINIHSGGVRSTSSLGCQTLPPANWAQFRPLLYSLLEEFKNPIRANDWGQRVRSFDYVLTEETDLRKGDLVFSTRYF